MLKIRRLNVANAKLATTIFTSVVVVMFLVLFINQQLQNERLLQALNQKTIIIEQNQKVNSVYIKNYIACLLLINPSGNIHQQEQTCFDNAPEVK